MTNILNGGGEPPNDDDWTDFLSQPMSTLVGVDTEIGANAPTGFRDRYNLAMRFVYLLGLMLIVGLGIFALTVRDDNLLVADDGETTGEVVEEPPAVTEAPVNPEGELTATTLDPESEATATTLEPDGEPTGSTVGPETTTTTTATTTTTTTTTTTEPSRAEAAGVVDTSRYEFVVQTDDAEGPFWYVLDKEAMTRLWAAECLNELGVPDREILWPELSTFDEPDVFTECEDLVPLIDNRPLIDPDAATQQAADSGRYEFVVQTDDAEGLFWYVLDNEEMTRLWAAECLDELGEPDREILWPELSTFAEPDVFTECAQLVLLIRDR